MAKIMLIRHGETEWNLEDIFRGQADIELNKTGIRQAGLLAKYLEDIPFEAIYSSPLKRALKTAETIADLHGIKVTVAPELTDFDYGKWQGLTLDKVKERYPQLYEEWLKNPQLTRMPNGEGLDNVSRRTTSMIDHVIAKHEGTFALVSHRVVNKVLICALLGLDNSHFWNIRLGNCGITTFFYENERFVLEKHNDTSFLEGARTKKSSDF
jgi:broad specificity phosphatase PhoE